MGWTASQPLALCEEASRVLDAACALSCITPAILLLLLFCPCQVLLGRPLFPGKNVVNQLELITDLLGTPAPEVIAKVCGGGELCACVGGLEVRGLP